MPFGWGVVRVAQEAEGAAVLVGACEAGAAGAGAWVEAGALGESDAADVATDDELLLEVDDVLLEALTSATFPPGQAQSGGVPGILKVGVVYGKCVLGSPVGDDEWFQMIVIVKSNSWFALLLLSARKATLRHSFASSAIGKLGLA